MSVTALLRALGGGVWPSARVAPSRSSWVAPVARLRSSLGTASSEGLQEGARRSMAGSDGAFVSAGIRAEEVARRGAVRLRAAAGDIALFSVRGTLYALDADCSHGGGPLECGTVDIEDVSSGACAVACPWHGFEFDLRTGGSSSGFAQRTYEVRVDGEGRVSVCVPPGTALTPDNALSPVRDGEHAAPAQAVAEDAAALPTGALSARVAQSTPRSLCEWAVHVLHTADPAAKIAATEAAVRAWHAGALEVGGAAPPDEPPRHDGLVIVAPGREGRRGRGGTLASRVAMLHSMANIEQWAIDLSWDIIARFAAYRCDGTDSALPREFFTDFVNVAADEAKHFRMLSDRLTALGSHYGALPVHKGLWQSARETSGSLLARLAVVHMVHEARGLDVHPKTVARFQAQGDSASVDMLGEIYRDEITHVAAGVRWFSYVCRSSSPQMEPHAEFRLYVSRYFQGNVKPPFNKAARDSAGMVEDWYMPLVAGTMRSS